MPLGEYAQTGIGDISRLLGYKFMESGKSAILAPVKFSFNTPDQKKFGLCCWLSSILAIIAAADLCILKVTYFTDLPAICCLVKGGNLPFW
jgi:hypothetical protein